jgi:hypothetical protein
MTETFYPAAAYSLARRCRELEAENARLREALRYYQDADWDDLLSLGYCWHEFVEKPSNKAHFFYDRGARARQALEADE